MDIRPHEPKQGEPAVAGELFDVAFSDLEMLTVREAYREHVAALIPEDEDMLDHEYDEQNERIMAADPELFKLSYCDNFETLEMAGVERMRETLDAFAAATARRVLEIRKDWRASGARNGTIVERMRYGRTARDMHMFLGGRLMNFVHKLDPAITTDSLSTSTEIVHVRDDTSPQMG